MKYPSIYTSKYRISADIVKREVESRLYYLKKKYPNADLRLLFLSQQKIENIYWIYALFMGGYQFAIISSEASSRELGLYKATLGECEILQVPRKLEVKKKIKCTHPLTYKQSKIILFTSGSSGKPKGIVLHYENFFHNAIAYQKHFQLKKMKINTWLCNLPLYHISGFSILMRSLLLGYNFAFEPRFRMASLKMWIKSGKIVGASIVPTILFRLVEEASKIHFHKNFHYLLVGGAAIPSSLKEKIIQQCSNWPIFTTYGATETCSQIATSRIQDNLQDRLLHLQPLDKVKIQINSSNEIFISGPMVRDEIIENGNIKLQSKIFQSGDLGQWNKEKLTIQITGRKSDIINSGGVKFSSDEIENIFSKLLKVKNCVAMGMPDQEWGEKLVVFYTTKNKKPIATEIKILQKLKKFLSSKKIPKKIFFLDEIPLTKSGKVDKKHLQTLFI